ncbi:MAG: histidine triad nucleotide-binding protein [Acidobacteriota bacterium]
MPEQETIFHKIAAGTAPADLVYSDDKVIAFRDINPQAPVHVLLIPREEMESLNDAAKTDIGILGHLLYTAAKVANQLGIAETGYRVVINTGLSAGQSVEYLHLHLLGGRDMTWPPG